MAADVLRELDGEAFKRGCGASKGKEIPP